MITSAVICCGFAVCWTPCKLTLLISFIAQRINFTIWFPEFAAVLVNASSCIIPLIYAVSLCEFQRGVKDLNAALRKRLNLQPEEADVVVEMHDVEQRQLENIYE